MSRDDFDRKLTDCLAISGLAWPSDTPARLRAAIERLEHAPRAASVVQPLTLS